MEQVTIDIKNGFATMDQLTELIDRLPRIQQAIVLTHITTKFSEDQFAPGTESGKKLANWIYGN